MTKTKLQFCRIRPDIINSESGVPIGKDFVTENIEYQYNWEDDKFYILYKKVWCKADSIDFEF